MATGLKGAPELKARLRAIKQSFKPIGRQWADTTADLAPSYVPNRTGRLRGSFRRRHASMKRASVSAHYTATFVDGGTGPHSIAAKRGRTLAFQGRGGQPVFARKVHHRGARAQPFKKRVADEGLRRTPMAGTLIDEWNKAAR